MSAIMTMLSIIAVVIIAAAWFPGKTGALHEATEQAMTVILPVAAIGGTFLLLGTNYWAAMLSGAIGALILGLSLAHGNNPISNWIN